MPVIADDRLRRQIAFIVEADRLKHVFRQTFLMDCSRREDSAEHSWHMSLMAALLIEYVDEPVDLLKVLRMALIHDIVEVDAGDLFIYDRGQDAAQQEKERQAAERLFSLLPADQARDCRALWEEFEARKTAEARYAAAVDRLQPLLHNYYTQGRAWREHGVTASRVISLNSRIMEASARLWDYALWLIEESVQKGYLEDDRKDHHQP